MKDQNNAKEDLAQKLRETQHLLPDSEASGPAFRQALVEMEMARRYAQNIIETIREALLVLDADLKVLSANRSFYTIFKVNPEETVGSYIYELGSQQWDIPGLRLLLEKILPQNSQFNDFEVEHDFPSIGHKVMMLNARQIHDEVISKRMILLAIEDITGLRKLERERRHILSMFAHDMRNPVVASEGFLSRIISGKAGVLTEKQQNYLEIIRDELNSVSLLIADFLDFSKFDAQEYTPIFTPLNVYAEIQKNIETEKMAAEKKQITLSLELPDTAISMVSADAAMINRVIRNLLDNAIKYTDAGGAVSVKAADIGNEILVSVKDTGIGIPKDRLTSIFDVFSRVKRDTKGSGLGLSIVKAIIEAHGGRIWVESIPAKGSVFSFTLPKA
ncbi:MAG: HAMP domain-containing sensor histidine kinase [Thermodesulfovibrionales bacterium]|jgi:PAS domain S-box-containing protein